MLSRTKRQSFKPESMPYGKVLVVDDVETNLYVAEGLLLPYRLQIETVLSGFEAIEKIDNGSTYDVIFMDHMMPHMDGIEATRILREKGYTGAIIALTANAITGNDEMFMEKGFDGFISKPIDVRRLNACLNRFIRDRHPMEAGKHFAHEADTEVRAEVDPKILEAFRRDALKAMETLSDTMEGGDLKLYTTTVHAMKSALANINQPERSAYASELEKAGEKGDTEFIRQNTSRFLTMLEALVNDIGADDDEGLAEDEAEDTELLTVELLKVVEACGEYDDHAAYTALDALEEKQWKSETAAALKNIRNTLFLHSDFDDAKAEAEKMIEERNGNENKDID